MTGARSPCARRRLLLAMVLVAAPLHVWAQSFDVRVEGDMLRVRGTGLRLVEGQVSEHLRDGRSVRVDFELTVLERAGGSAVTRGQQTFILSFDLWEQRYAVTRAGAPPRAISHLTARDVESWCLENVTIPMTALTRLGRDTPFWIRVDYHVHDRTPAANSEDDSAFTLRRLIDVLSRRRQDEESGRSLEAGPFRLRN